jgi:hypothetical protein
MKPSNKERTKYKKKKDRSLLFLTLAVVGLFLGIGSCIGFYAYTLIDIYNLSKFFIAFTVAGFLIPLKYYQRWFHFIKYEVIIFNVIGVGPFLSGLFLCMNFFITSNAHTEKYRIAKIYSKGEGYNRTLGIILEKKLFSGEDKITELKEVRLEGFSGNSYLKLTLADGLFGYQVIQEKSFTK